MEEEREAQKARRQALRKEAKAGYAYCLRDWPRITPYAQQRDENQIKLLILGFLFTALVHLLLQVSAKVLFYGYIS